MPGILVRTPEGRLSWHHLDGDELTLGRGRDCGLALEDRAVSRLQARLARRDGHWYVQDLGSRFGTLLNGRALMGETELADGDFLRCGESFLLYRQVEAEAADAGRLAALAAQATAAAAREIDATILAHSEPAAAVPTPAPATLSGWRHSVLAEAAEKLQAATALPDVLRALLGIAFDVMSPERGVVLLAGSGDGDLEPAVSQPEGAAGTISWSVVRRAVESRETILVADAAHDERFQDAASIFAQAIRAVACCPLVARGRLVGALYLDTRAGDLAARREELGLLNLVAGYAATAIDNALLVAAQQAPDQLRALDAEPLVAESAAMAGVAGRLPDLAAAAGPLLVAGEPGTGRFFLARRLHTEGPRAAAPFVVLDATSPPSILRPALFGPDGQGGAWREAAGGTLVLRHLEALDPLLQSDLEAALAASGDEGRAAPRLIATTAADLAALAGERRFYRPLAERILPGALSVPPLRERREDVLPLARLFLPSGAVLGESGERALRAAKCRRANVAELREAVALAAVLAGGREIGSEHVFTGPRARNHRLEFEVGGSGLARALTRRGTTGALQATLALVFAGTAAACLLVPGQKAGAAANAAIWGLWWPALLLSFAFVGRVWCYLCPLSRLARWAQSAWSLGRRPAAWLKERGGWLMAALFLAVVWSEHAFDMPRHPFATGIFLLTLFLLAAGFALVVQREAWCRSACPLGGLAGSYAAGATLHVHSNPLVCAGQCRTHDCFKGSEREPGCPVSVHPLYLRDAQLCKLCLGCLRNCRHGSARLWLRPPLQDIWTLGEIGPALLPLALTAVLLAPVMLASATREAIGGDLALYSALALGAAALAAALVPLLPRTLSRDGDGSTAPRVASAFLVAAWGPLMAFHLGNVPGLGGLVVGAAPATVGTLVLPAEGLALLPALRVLVVALAAVAGLWTLRLVLRGARPLARRGLPILLLLYVAGAAALAS